jgi:hypothetical protein
MVVELLLGIFLAPVEWALSAIPALPIPGVFDGGDCTLPCSGTLQGGMHDVGARLGLWNGWVDLAAIFQAAPAAAAVAVVTIGVRMVRVLVSLVTGGGGSAA